MAHAYHWCSLIHVCIALAASGTVTLEHCYMYSAGTCSDCPRMSNSQQRTSTVRARSRNEVQLQVWRAKPSCIEGSRNRFVYTIMALHTVRSATCTPHSTQCSVSRQAALIRKRVRQIHPLIAFLSKWVLFFCSTLVTKVSYTQDTT